MNKSDLQSKLIPDLASKLTPAGYKYVKSRESFESGSKRLHVDVNYWNANNYCITSLHSGIYFRDIQKYRHSVTSEDVKEMNTVYLRSDCSWTYSNDNDYENNLREVFDFTLSSVIPHLTRLDDREYVLERILDRSIACFMNEYSRMMTLLSLAKFSDDLNLSKILDSFDPSIHHKNQLISHDRTNLEKFTEDFPELSRILQIQYG